MCGWNWLLEDERGHARETRVNGPFSFSPASAPRLELTQSDIRIAYHVPRREIPLFLPFPPFSSAPRSPPLVATSRHAATPSATQPPTSSSRRHVDTLVRHLCRAKNPAPRCAHCVWGHRGVITCRPILHVPRTKLPRLSMVEFNYLLGLDDSRKSARLGFMDPGLSHGRHRRDGDGSDCLEMVLIRVRINKTQYPKLEEPSKPEISTHLLPDVWTIKIVPHTTVDPTPQWRFTTTT